MSGREMPPELNPVAAKRIAWKQLSMDFWSAEHNGRWLVVRPTASGRRYQGRIQTRTVCERDSAEEAMAAVAYIAMTKPKLHADPVLSGFCRDPGA